MKSRILASLGLIGVLASPALRAETTFPAEAYDRIFPAYAEACTASQLAWKVGMRGNAWGHGFVFVKGLCVDDSAPYPKVKVCEGDAPGTVISMNQMYKNVLFTAIEGRDYGHRAGVAPGKPVNDAELRRLTAELVARGVYRGVTLNTARIKDPRPAGMSDVEWLAYNAIGTDVALAWARDIACTRMPLHPRMLPRVADYLNELNREAYEKGDSEFYFLNNNCAHLVHNLAATIGAVAPRRTKLPTPINLATLTLPTNVVTDWTRAGNDGFVGREDAALALYRDPVARRAFAEYDGWLRHQPGALVLRTDQIDSASGGNEIFKDSPGVFKGGFLLGLLGGKAKSLTRAAATDRYTDLTANLADHEARAERSLRAIRGRPAGYAELLERGSFVSSAREYRALETALGDALEATIDRIRTARAWLEAGAN
jgi:hypothetical protein